MTELVFTKQGNSTQQSQEFSDLDRLWKKLKKHEKRNQNLVNKQDKLYQQFSERIEPYEHAYCAAMASKIEHLIGFLPRKSLSKAQKSELMGWIEYEISGIEYHPFLGAVDISELRKTFSQVLNSSVQPMEASEEDIELMRVMLTEMFEQQLGVTVEFSDDELSQMTQDPDYFEQMLNQKMAEFHEQEQKAFEQRSHHQQNTHQQAHNGDKESDFNYFFDHDFTKERQQALSQIFKSSQLNKIYKRLAAILHPDKVKDVELKDERKELMQTLSDARKNNDAFTLLKFYQEYVPEAEFSFDQKTLTAIGKLLIEKNAVLNQQYQELKTGHSAKSIVWQQFSSRSKREIELNFTEHLDALLNATADLEYFIEHYRTVKSVAKVLSERIQHNRNSFFSQNALEQMLGL